MASSDSDASPVKVLEEARPRRSKNLPIKLRDTMMELEELAPVTKRESRYRYLTMWGQVSSIDPTSSTFCLNVGKVTVRCAQNGKCFASEVSHLSFLDGQPIRNESDLYSGASLLWDVYDKSYPVVFLGFNRLIAIDAEQRSARYDAK